MTSSFNSIVAFYTQGLGNQSIYLSGQKILATIFVMKTVRERDSKILKAGLTLNDLYDTTCMTYNRLSHFYGVYTIMQVVHTKFIKVAPTDYSAFRSSGKMI